MPIRRNLTTEQKIKKKIANGDGQGDGTNYRPFVRVGDFACVGRVHRILSPDGRIQHFFSDLEKDYYYHLLWDDCVIEIKEKYPLKRETTMRIAEVLGIKHPTDPRTKVPTVMTTDFAITALTDGKKRTFARSIMYQSDLNKQRVREKQTLEKMYWDELGVEWKIITEQSFNRDRSRNIQYLMNYYLQDQIVDGLPSAFLIILAERLLIERHKPLAHVCGDIDAELGLQRGRVLAAMYYYAAHKTLPVCLDRRWYTWKVDEVIDIQKLQEYWREGIYGQEAASGG